MLYRFGKKIPFCWDSLCRSIINLQTRIACTTFFHCSVVYFCRQLDRDNLGVIKRYQFKDLLEARFKVKVSDEELESVLRLLLEESNHSLIPYARFLELFSSSRYSFIIIESNLISTDIKAAGLSVCII